MRNGDFYKHYKGNEYFFDSIALPLPDTMKNKAKQNGKARYHENTHDVDLYFYEGVTYIDADVPHVIYQAEVDYDTTFVYAREIDDFFEHKQLKDGQYVKRFILKEG